MADGVALLRLGRTDRAAARARLLELSPEELALACQELRPEARSEFLMLVEHPEDVVPLLAEAELVHTVRAGGMSEAAWLLELATTELAAFNADRRPRNRTSASAVSFGRSSMSQCPVLARVMFVTFAATSCACFPSASPLAFSPPIERTGIVNLLWENREKSFAAC